ncbi:helix-turn-helix transcriptional regulator [Methylobacterium sp. NEAU 140]|uniref:helix-turn-helix transcriptional regulator n=1 Tax=Methylobacterium sp. NEAU 140 TaxID=3064945 RepID=UPI002735EB6F|nr:helix-turn-helix transcriptional regulator [Methylobacterium sp. NEAU 140]MDP4024437.1 helix-turn-helix transcriptional regulator [Methylobacterium sp. NEAU 140]
MQWFEKIKARREELGISQADLAKSVDISQAAINKIEKGTVLKSRFLPRIARKLNLKLEDLDQDYKSTYADAIDKIEGIVELGYKLLSDDKISETDGDTDLFLVTGREDGFAYLYNRTFGKIDRPPYLKKLKHVCAFLLDQPHMYPELENGDIIFGTTDLDPVEESTCLFVSKDFRLPDAALCKIRRVTHINDDSWATMQWDAKKRDENTEIFLKKEWFVGFRIVAKYYGRFTAWKAQLPD